MWARKSGDSTWEASSLRLRSFQAGSMEWKTAGVSVSGTYQPRPNPSPLVVSAPMREWRDWSMIRNPVVEYTYAEEDRVVASCDHGRVGTSLQESEGPRRTLSPPDRVAAERGEEDRGG